MGFWEVQKEVQQLAFSDVLFPNPAVPSRKVAKNLKKIWLNHWVFCCWFPLFSRTRFCLLRLFRKRGVLSVPWWALAQPPVQFPVLSFCLLQLQLRRAVSGVFLCRSCGPLCVGSNTQCKESGDVCREANESILFFIKCHLQCASKQTSARPWMGFFHLKDTISFF